MQSIAQIAGVFFFTGLWQGFLLAALVWTALRLAPKASAALRFAIWAVTLVVIGLLPLIEHLTASSTAVPSATHLQLDIRWSYAIAALWLAASLVRATNLAIQALHLWQLRRRARPVETGVSLIEGVRLCTSTDVDRPSVVGFFAPRILIPVWLHQQLTAAELDQIVLHEMEHLRRHDDWLNLLQKLSLVLFPLNPIVLWVERRLCFERELACDDGVLRLTRAPRAYATCLTDLAERGLNRRTGLLALGALGATVRQSELAQRVHRILRNERTLSPLRARLLAGTVALGVLGGATELARYPELVSFAAPTSALHAEAIPVSILGDRSDLAGKLIPASFQQGTVPHMTLLSADMDRRAPAKPVAIRPKTRHVHKAVQPVKPALKRVSENRSSTQQQSWMILTSLSTEQPTTDREDSNVNPGQPRLFLPVVDTDNHLLPYAAVPTADGWLLVQL
jgi:beta-lactamase regulating signal transducer with metallopeptidase domain